MAEADWRRASLDLLTTQRRLRRSREWWLYLVRDWPTALGLTIVLALGLVAAGAPLLAPHDPTAVDPAKRLRGPSLEHPLGTDNLGRDIFSRLVFGSRYSLGTAIIATALVITIGVAVGTVSGYYRGPLDDLLMRLVDILLAFPSLVLALAIAGTLGPGIGNVIIGLVSVWWVSYARIVRGIVLSLREQHFVEAAQCLGARDHEVIVRHILPNVAPPVIVLATLETGHVILAISGLNFLGLGTQPPTPEWGAMLNESRAFLLTAPQLMAFPGVAISLAVIGFNLLGDGLRDLLDPKTRRSRKRVSCWR